MPRAWFILTVFVITVVPAAGLQFCLLRLSKPAAQWFPVLYYRFLAKLIGLNIVQRGQPVRPPVLWVANHVSWMDIIVLGSQRPLKIVAKREVGEWPLLGLLAKLTGSLFVDRQQRRASLRASQEIKAALQGGRTVMLFPEGTSSAGTRVLRFRSSLFKCVERVPGDPGTDRIQPISIVYTMMRGLPLARRHRAIVGYYGDMTLFSHLRQALDQGPFEVELRFHRVINAQAGDDRKDLALKSEETIRKGVFAALQGRLGSPP